MRRTVPVLMAGLLAFLSQSTKAQAPESGQQLFAKRCGGCHGLDSDKEGPRLRGVYGRAAGAVGSFQYSDGMKKAKLVWTGENLDRWLADPESLVPKNDMAFRVEKADERRIIIDFLKGQTQSAPTGK